MLYLYIQACGTRVKQRVKLCTVPRVTAKNKFSHLHKIMAAVKAKPTCFGSEIHDEGQPRMNPIREFNNFLRQANPLALEKKSRTGANRPKGL